MEVTEVTVHANDNITSGFDVLRMVQSHFPTARVTVTLDKRTKQWTIYKAVVSYG